jgi:tetratricopeptide (TPR) repeat protein
MREALTFTRQVGDRYSLPYYLHNLGLTLGFQKRYQEASEHFAGAFKIYDQRDKSESRERGIALGFQAAILIKQGELDQATAYLAQSLAIKEKFQDISGTPELLNWLGEIEEIRFQQGAGEGESAPLTTAEDYYHQSLGYRRVCRRHFECNALTSLVRIKYAQRDYRAISPLLTEAEQLAQEYEYNDHLASLRLTQGHITWDGHIPEWGSDFEAALSYYQQALIYALRYNRFLLDEVLWGDGIITPLQPIIPSCQERGEAGRQMLIVLRDWWQSGNNDIGTPRPDTISPIPENIPLLEAEQIARQREPGDGSPQPTVLEKLEAALL